MQTVSATYNGRENADGSTNLTVRVTLGDFRDENEMRRAYKVLKGDALLRFLDKEINGQTELPTGKRGKKSSED